jgi:hypothetical protein
MAEGLPLYTQSVKFKATGIDNVFTANMPLIPMTRIPSVWSIQVTGLAADGKTIAAASAWEVNLEGSIDGIAYDDDAGTMLNHKGGVNANGAVVKSNNNFMAARFVQLHCKTLTLGPADSILVNVVGI